MKINELIKYFEQDNGDQVTARRSLLKDFGVKIAMASIPFAAGSLYTNKAYGQSKETIINILNYLLKYEQVKEKVNSEAKDSKVIPDAYSALFDAVIQQNKAQRASIEGLITELGGNAVIIPADDIDVSGGFGTNNGPFASSFTSGEEFLELAQFLADAGERIYKGQITEVTSDKISVQTLMNIHSVKAREATMVRYARKDIFDIDINPWITNSDSNIVNPSAQRAYSGEAVTNQNGVNLVGINGFTQITAEIATEAFDEPLNIVDGNNIVNRFIKI